MVLGVNNNAYVWKWIAVLLFLFCHTSCSKWTIPIHLRQELIHKLRLGFIDLSHNFLLEI